MYICAASRLAAGFMIQAEQGLLGKQWAWEPQMGESLILLLSDPNDVHLRTPTNELLHLGRKICWGTA